MQFVSIKMTFQNATFKFFTCDIFTNTSNLFSIDLMFHVFKKKTYMIIRVMRKCNIILRNELTKHNVNMNVVAIIIASFNKNIFFESKIDCYKDWFEIRKIFKRLYWIKIWIYQKVINIASTRFYCEILFFDMILLNATVYIVHHFSKYIDTDFKFKNIAKKLVFVIKTFRNNDKFKYDDILFEFFDHFRIIENNESRDKMYVSLNFVSNVIVVNIQSDYFKSLKEIYKYVVRFSFSQSFHEFQIFEYVIHFVFDSKYMMFLNQNVNFSSWIFDFRNYRDFNVFNTTLTNEQWIYKFCESYISHNVKSEKNDFNFEKMKIDQIIFLFSIWKTNVFNIFVIQFWISNISDAIYAVTRQIMNETFRIIFLIDINVITKSRNHIINFALLNAKKNKMFVNENNKKNRMNVSLKISNVKRFEWTTKKRMKLLSSCAKVKNLLYHLCKNQIIYILRKKRNEIFDYVEKVYVHDIKNEKVLENHETKRKMILTWFVKTMIIFHLH